MKFGEQRVVVIIEDFLGVTFHGEAEGELLVVTVKVNTSLLISFPFSGYGEVLFQSREGVFGVVFLHILNAKIIYY